MFRADETVHLLGDHSPFAQADEPVTGIGRAVGWPDQNHFARCFKAHYGLSATTYRKRFATRAAHLRGPSGDGPGQEP